MTVPLIVLGAFSLFAGILNPGFHLMHNKKPLDHWLEPVFRASTEGAVLVGHVASGVWTENKEWAEHMEWPLAAGGLLAFAAGTGLAAWMYLVKKGEPARQLAEALPGLYRLVVDKWRIDELYDATILAGVESLAETSAAVDKWIVDGILARLTALLVAATGSILRAIQTGVVQVYAATMVVGLAALGWFFAVPHPEASVVDAGNDDYLLTAAPGVGYQYRWDTGGDPHQDAGGSAGAKPSKPEFGSEATLKVHVEPGKTTTVHLEVKNAFGLVKGQVIPVSRPPALPSPAGVQT
jgi:NADH-quinone oxidoreductase subunit L